MNKNIGIIFGILVIVVIGIVYSSTKKEDTGMVKDSMDSKVMLKEDSDAMMQKDESVMAEKNNVMMASGSYEVYSPEKVALASATHDVVLFFRASWCPTCRALDGDIKASLSKIPSDLAILDVNYDDSSSLKQKYGVTYQHTFVQVDKDGNLIKKW